LAEGPRGDDDVLARHCRLAVAARVREIAWNVEANCARRELGHRARAALELDDDAGTQQRLRARHHALADERDEIVIGEARGRPRLDRRGSFVEPECHEG
jgi:hypothetical protein